MNATLSIKTSDAQASARRPRGIVARIMRHEWMLLSREKVLLVILPVYLLLIGYGVANGVAWKQFLAGNTAEAVALADKGFTSKIVKLDRMLSGQDPYTYAEDPRVAGPLARYKGYEMAAKLPSASAAIAIGQSDVLPSYLKVQWKPMFKQTNTDETRNPKNLAIGALDLSFVLVYLYPLLIIALSYNILSSERENGTQGLLLSQPVSIRQFVWGKILLRSLLVIGLGVGASVVGLAIGSPDILTAGEGWRLAALTAMLTLYGAFWCGLAVLVNAFGRKSPTNALMLMGIWIALVLIVPAALNLYAKAAYPLPSRIEMVQALRRGDRVAEQRTGGFERSYRSDLLRKGEESALEASSNDFYKRVLPLEEQGEAIARPIFLHFEAQRRAQQAVTERLKYLSPAAIMQIGLSELANQSAADFNDYSRQVEAYHQRWRSYFLKPVLANRALTRDEMVAIPRFRYRAEGADIVSARLAPDIAVLLMYAGLALVIGFAWLQRYPAAAK